MKLSNRIKILLVDDHGLFRQGIMGLIEKEQDMEVIGEADTGREALRMADALKPDVVIMDITMPDLNGIDATHQIRQSNPDIKIIALSMYTDRQHVDAMIRAGVSGYVAKGGTYDELVNAIRDVHRNKLYLSSHIDEIVRNEYFKLVIDVAGAGGEPLSLREREVLQLIAEGNSTKEISDRLHLSIKTVEAHRANIMEKLNIHSTAGLTKYAIRLGITPP